MTKSERNPKSEARKRHRISRKKAQKAQKSHSFCGSCAFSRLFYSPVFATRLCSRPLDSSGIRSRPAGSFVILLQAVLLAACAGLRLSSLAGTVSQPQPRVFLLDAKYLQAARQRLRSGDTNMAPALAQLEADARKALDAGPYSVVNKKTTPPSGDKHDYMSQAPYFWPNPNTANGLPYIRRDGARNPEINKITDHRSLDQIESSVETLALAYYFKGDEAYAAKADQLLRAFFLDTATRMNPNLQSAQLIPGFNTGRGIGLIETRGLTQIV